MREHGEESLARARRQRAVHVFDDADLDAAVEGAMASKYRNTGQTCVCANRIFVQDGVYDAFAGSSPTRCPAESRQRAGSGRRAGPADRHESGGEGRRAHPDALGKGARVVTGGKRHEKGGQFFQPTVLADVTPR